MGVVVLDVETTGLNPDTDRIIQFSGALLDKDMNEVDRLSLLIDPRYPIDPGASAVHGYTGEQLTGCPTFQQVGARILDFLGDHALAGHNILAFDLLVLMAELKRHLNIDLDMTNRQVVDTLELFRQQVPHTLEGASQHYCGTSVENAHDADADVSATVSVLKAQLQKIEGGLEVAAKDSMGARATYDGKIVYDEEGELCLSFGKHAGTRLSQIDYGYRQWMLGQSFSAQVKALIQESFQPKTPTARRARSDEHPF